MQKCVQQAVKEMDHLLTSSGLSCLIVSSLAIFDFLFQVVCISVLIFAVSVSPYVLPLWQCSDTYKIYLMWLCCHINAIQN